MNYDSLEAKAEAIRDELAALVAQEAIAPMELFMDLFNDDVSGEEYLTKLRAHFEPNEKDIQRKQKLAREYFECRCLLLGYSEELTEKILAYCDACQNKQTNFAGFAMSAIMDGVLKEEWASERAIQFMTANPVE